MRKTTIICDNCHNVVEPESFAVTRHTVTLEAAPVRISVLITLDGTGPEGIDLCKRCSIRAILTTVDYLQERKGG